MTITQKVLIIVKKTNTPLEIEVIIAFKGLNFYKQWNN